MLICELLLRGQLWQAWLHRVAPGPSDEFEIRFSRVGDLAAPLTVLIDSEVYRALVMDDTTARRSKLLPVLERGLYLADESPAPSADAAPAPRRLSTATLATLGRMFALRAHTSTRAAHYALCAAEAEALPVIEGDRGSCIGVVRRAALESGCFAARHDSDACVVLNHLERGIALVTEHELAEEISLAGATHPLVVMDERGCPLRVVLP